MGFPRISESRRAPKKCAKPHFFGALVVQKVRLCALLWCFFLVLTPVSFITTMAHQGDTKIEVSDPDCFPVGKYIVLQESLIYTVTGKGSLILDRPLSRDFLTGTSVRLLTDADQYRAESTDIYLQNPQSSHFTNGERRNSQFPMEGMGAWELTPLLNRRDWT